MTLEKIIKNVFNVKPNESILIVTDKKKLKIAKRFYKASKKLTKNVKIILKPVGKYNGEEPPKNVAREMLKHDIVLAPTTHSITHTKARINACKKGARIATLPGITEEMLHESLLANPKELENYAKKILKVLRNKRLVRVTTKNGTNIILSLWKRKLEPDTAKIGKGEYGNLPAGEVSFSPVEGSANGIIVIDSMEDYVKPGTKVLVFNGLVFGISDHDCKLAKIFEKVKNSRNIAEFGIGINKKAKLIGKILQDEKVLGTCHIAFGNNESYGGKVYSQVHLDCILKKPTIIIENKTIMKDGKFLI
jgi:leucyl aminopeptidase (aminopeptidase T)